MNRVEEAFAKVNRADFMPTGIKSQADVDSALPIGYGQTISQPTTVRMMLNWLDVRPGQKVLDVGSGSGWTTALLSFLTGTKGEVLAIERIPELVEFGAENCKRIGTRNTRFFQAGPELGLPRLAPFKRILVSAAASEIPDNLTAQLSPGGRMVIPVDNSVFVVDKSTTGEIITTEHYGFVFVPLL